VTTGLYGFRPTLETRQAMLIRQTFDKTCAGIRADPDLSEVGKEKAMRDLRRKHGASQRHRLVIVQDAHNSHRRTLPRERGLLMLSATVRVQDFWLSERCAARALKSMLRCVLLESGADSSQRGVKSP